jgi:hypothetical protein
LSNNALNTQRNQEKQEEQVVGPDPGKQKRADQRESHQGELGQRVESMNRAFTVDEQAESFCHEEKQTLRVTPTRFSYPVET